jgi:xylulokinase
LQFLPYLSGERTPHPDPLARGAFIGLTLRHGRAHLTRAVLEGVAFGLKDSFTLIQSAGLGDITQVRASGGGAKSALWRQILASVLDAELVTVNTTEGAAYGAALLAGVGAGVWASTADACQTAVQITGVTRPHPESAEMYRQTYAAYRGLYPALRESFPKLNAGA